MLRPSGAICMAVSDPPLGRLDRFHLYQCQWPQSESGKSKTVDGARILHGFAIISFACLYVRIVSRRFFNIWFQSSPRAYSLSCTTCTTEYRGSEDSRHSLGQLSIFILLRVDIRMVWASPTRDECFCWNLPISSSVFQGYRISPQ